MRDDLEAPRLADLMALDDAAFRARFAGSPVKRIGRDRFVRNVLIAAGNSRDAGLIGPCRRLLADGSPLVRGAAVWALSRLMEADAFLALKQAEAGETDDTVRAEWQTAAQGGHADG